MAWGWGESNAKGRVRREEEAIADFGFRIADWTANRRRKAGQARKAARKDARQAYAPGKPGGET